MIVEIRKAGFVNKGAELMLHAVIQKIKDRYPDAILVMAPTHTKASQPFHKLVRLGFFPKASLWRYGIQWGDLAALLPRKLREMYGLVLDKDVDVVLDAAGFFYSDQWGGHGSAELARSSKRWRKRGTKVILLPQALGPYETRKHRVLVKRWAKNVNLIFVREKDSYDHIVSLVGEQDKVRLFPDFTNLVEGVLPEDYAPENNRVALVPNYRMIDKTLKEEGEAYLPFMIYCAKRLVENGARPFVLVHEGKNDQMLGETISEAAGGIPVVIETDPLHIKGIIGTCDATIGSRFHGLVSALSQGVPSLATGWSHKYKRLFEDYDFPEGVVTVLDDKSEVDRKIELLTNSRTASSVRDRLKHRSTELKMLSEKMWELVFAEIDKR